MVLVLEMFIFLLGCVGLMGLTGDYLVQPALFFVLVLSMLGSSAVVAMALMLHIYLPVMEGTAFMTVRSAWHWSFTVVVTATMLVVAVTQAGRVEQDNWKRILWQSDMRADVSSTTASMIIASSSSIGSLFNARIAGIRSFNRVRSDRSSTISGGMSCLAPGI